MSTILLGLFATCAIAGVNEPIVTAENLMASGRFNEARAILEPAAKTDRHDSELATVLNNLGSVYYELGRLRDAQHAYERSLALRRDAGEGDTREVARTLSNLGVAYLDLKY